jgi:hypothetical protein
MEEEGRETERRADKNRLAVKAAKILLRTCRDRNSWRNTSRPFLSGLSRRGQSYIAVGMCLLCVIDA